MEEKDMYLRELYKAYDYSTTEFDKSLTFIASGMLAVSFAFIEKLVLLTKATSKNLLINGWYFLAIAIIVSVLAHFINIYLLKVNIRNYKSIDDTIQKRSRRKGDIIIQAMNIGSMILIAIGSYNIISFIKINI